MSESYQQPKYNYLTYHINIYLQCKNFKNKPTWLVFFFSFILISCRLITLQYCRGFCHTLIWISHGFTCIPHPDPPSHLPLYPIPLGLPSAPGPSTRLMHPTCAHCAILKDNLISFHHPLYHPSHLLSTARKIKGFICGPKLSCSSSGSYPRS